MNLIIASGPVIIEKGKVLLDKHGKDEFWKFPGGTIKRGESPEKCAKRCSKKELNIRIELIRPLKPIIIWEKGRTIILVHYLAKRTGTIKPASHVREWKWMPIKKLSRDVGPNVRTVLKSIN